MLGFIGTTNYHEHKVTDSIKLLLTDGCEFVRHTADARWLFDEILFNQPRPEIRNLSHQVWILWYDTDEDEEGGCWALRCEDGNDKVVLIQMLPVEVLFPTDEIRILVVDGVAMLPSEY